MPKRRREKVTGAPLIVSWVWLWAEYKNMYKLKLVGGV